MRVHRLEVTAFGPFAERQVVDFEPLNAAGVFLLTGSTGAGKTSILDAICFGLYGQVPGVRDKAKAYRSHHAAADVAPRVVLEVTVQGRRLRITRSAAWTRPSRRARSGSVEEKARATLEEEIDGHWTARSSRVDEVGHLVNLLLGLNRDQFCQVVMLPQGNFQAFLRSGARDRQQILETIFGTSRFQAVERWLADHRREASRRCRAAEEELGRLLARLHEAASPPIKGLTWALDALTTADPDLVDQVAAALGVGAAEQHAVTQAAADAAVMAKQAVHEYDEARTLADRQERMLAARREHTALLAVADVVAARSASIDRARSAALLEPARALAEEAVAAHRAAATAAEQAWKRCESSWGPSGGMPQIGDVRAAVTSLTRRLVQLESLLALDLERLSMAERVAAARGRRSALADKAERLRAEVKADPAAVAELRTAVVGAAALVQRGVGNEDRLRRANQIRVAAEEAVEHELAVSDLQERALEARERAADATQVWLEARERHLAGMAAELAGLLEPDQSCPVCGSTSHPEPAVAADSHVTGAEERQLFAAVTAARAAHESLETERAQRSALRLQAVERSGGYDVPSAAKLVERAEHDRDVAATATQDHERLRDELAQLLTAAEARVAALSDVTAEMAELDGHLVEWETQRESAQSTLDRELAGHDSVREALACAANELAGAEALEQALLASAEAARGLVVARRRFDDALELSPFPDVAALVKARLPETEIAHRETLNRGYQDDLAHCLRVLNDPTLVMAAAEDPPDLDALERAAVASARTAQISGQFAAAVDRRQERLAQVLALLSDLASRLAPLRAARDLADDVAGMVSGTSADNPTRTALSHYVLMARLGQVVAAANLRLDSIGGGRYQLEHIMGRGVGDSRGGLGLVVRDTYTDQARDPATLSGGETFYVSLALALGLADVVMAEAGGTELATLFVDEGFGSLDDDTRDEVLDELDALRSGGRSVGLVSHLPELRARCAAQLRIVSSPRGSHCLVGDAASC